jgi:alpha-D-ribose 1-methylphosphonate 5-triphosphate diphosphatase
MWLTNLRIVLPDNVLECGAIRIDGERIAEVAQSGPIASRNEQIIDGRGCVALPGAIDIHGDMVEREIEPRPGATFPTAMAIHELDKRLAACGVTTAYAALSFWDNRKAEDARKHERVRDTTFTLNRLRPTLLVDHMIHARYEVATPGIAPALIELLAARQVQLLSLMDHTPGQGQYRDLERYVEFTAKFRQVPRDAVAQEIEERMREALHGAEKNWDLAREIVAQAQEQGLPIASHDDDTPEKVDLVQRIGATIAEFPVTMEAAREARVRGMHVVMGAPNVLRGSSHSGNLSGQEAITAGVVDMLAADYHPASLIHAVFALAEREILPLHQAARLVGQNPAGALGLEGRGQIAPGFLADIALVEPGANGDPARVRGTIRRGRAIYWDGYLDVER